MDSLSTVSFLIIQLAIPPVSTHIYIYIYIFVSILFSLLPRFLTLRFFSLDRLRESRDDIKMYIR